jgi:uncharacterized protein (DUF433 family)
MFNPNEVVLRAQPGANRLDKKHELLRTDPNVLGGTPVFSGTRVPVQSLFDYLEGGETIDEFLRQFPSVSHEQAVGLLELARKSVLTGAHSP